MAGDQQNSSAVDCEEPDTSWSVFHSMIGAWEPTDIALLSRWKQGHLLTKIPLTWIIPPNQDVVTGYFNESKTSAPVVDTDLVVEAAILCSQTCDIGADAAVGVAHPFVLVAPLVRLSQVPRGEQYNLARENKLGYLFPTLSPFPENSDETWYVDLRLMVPLSKSVLLSRKPIEGFSTEEESLSFSETIAQKFRRPALSEKLSDVLPKMLRKYIADHGRRMPAFQKVEQVRLIVSDGTRLFPSRVQLIVLVNSLLTQDEETLWRDFDSKAKRAMTEAGLNIVPMLLILPKDLSAERYRLSVPIHCDLLGFPSFP